MTWLSEKELKHLAASILAGRPVEELSDETLLRLVTAFQYLARICANELYGRNLVRWIDNEPAVPYCSRFNVELFDEAKVVSE